MHCVLIVVVLVWLSLSHREKDDGMIPSGPGISHVPLALLLLYYGVPGTRYHQVEYRATGSTPSSIYLPRWSTLR